MNIASRPEHSSLAQRIVKVRNCILVEVATGIAPTDKDLFVSLCQTYEQSNVETPCTATASSKNALDQAYSFMSDRATPPSQYRVGFSTIKWPNLADFDDWDDRP
jgi:hypothetical protein